MTECSDILFLQLALLDKYEEVLAKATAVAEDRRRTGTGVYKVSTFVARKSKKLEERFASVAIEWTTATCTE